MHRHRPYLLALGISVMLICGLILAAEAATITVADSIDETFLPISDALTVPQFDPGTGILTSVRVTMTTLISGSFQYGNPLSISQSVSGQVDGSAAISVPGGSEIPIQQILAVVNDTLPALATRQITFSETLSTVQEFTDPAVLDAFSGLGMVSLPVTVTAGWNAGGNNANISILILSTGDARSQVEFVFEIPQVVLEKYTNGVDADSADDADVPVINPGDPVTWTYLVTNTGTISIPLADVFVGDSQPGVLPQFVPTSDDGDELLAPGEAWVYRATGIATDLRTVDPQDELTIVDGCTDGFGPHPTYENVGTVIVPGAQDDDPSHYCNPSIPGIVIQKATNGADADDPNGADVPELAPGDGVTWRYVITNTGNVTLTTSQVTVTDSTPGIVPQLDAGSDDGDGLLSPGERWVYAAQGIAVDLLDPAATAQLTIVNGCTDQTYGPRATYNNVATVEIPGARDQDPSHYCNPVAPGIDIEKFTNGNQADLPNDPDVPLLAPGATARWDYIVTNRGNVTFTLEQVSVTDDSPGVVPRFDPAGDDGDGVLSPGESWTYVAVGTALDLDDPQATAEVTVLSGCSQSGSATLPPRATYANTGRVEVPGADDEDDSHYCNPTTPTAITLAAFNLQTDDAVIELRWSTGAEMQTAGFLILRSTTHDRADAVQINERLIPSGAAVDGSGLRRYQFEDRSAVPGILYRYWLVEVDLAGVTRAYGPILGRIRPAGENNQVFLPLVLMR